MSRLIDPLHLDLYTKGLLSDIKEQVEKEVMNRLVEDFKKEVSPIVKDALKGAVFLRVEHMHNALRMADELYVSVKIDEDVEKRKVGGRF